MMKVLAVWGGKAKHRHEKKQNRVIWITNYPTHKIQEPEIPIQVVISAITCHWCDRLKICSSEQNSSRNVVGQSKHFMFNHRPHFSQGFTPLIGWNVEPPSKKFCKQQWLINSYQEKLLCLCMSRLHHDFCIICYTDANISHQGATCNNVLLASYTNLAKLEM